MNTECMFQIPSETTEIEVRKDYLPAFAFQRAHVSDTGAQSREHCLEDKARHLRVLEDASWKVFADDRGYKGNILNGKGEIVSFELTNGYRILLLPDIATPLENPRVREAMAQLFVSIHALRHTVFVDGTHGLGWDFAQPDMLALDPHPLSPLAVIAQGIQQGYIDRATLEFDNIDVNYLLKRRSRAKPVYHMLCYEKATGLENSRKVVYSRLALPAITSCDLPARFSARSEHELREQMLNELEKTGFLVFTAFSRQAKEQVDIHALIWCLEHIDTLTEITRKLASRETLASLYAALALAPHLFEGRRRGAIGTIESRELIVYRRTKMPYSIISEFEDGTGAIDDNVLFDRAISLYSPDLEHIRALIGEERVKRLMSQHPEYGSGEVGRAAQRQLSWPRDNIWPTVSRYDQTNFTVTMSYLRS